MASRLFFFVVNCTFERQQKISFLSFSLPLDLPSLFILPASKKINSPAHDSSLLLLPTSSVNAAMEIAKKEASKINEKSQKQR